MPPPVDHLPQQRCDPAAFRRLVEKRPLAREHFPEQHGERVEVAPSVQLRGRSFMPGVEGLQMLRRHGGEAAAEIGGRTVRRVGGVRTGVEVAEADGAVGRQEYVGRLHVAVQDARRMGMIESVRQLDADAGHGCRPREPFQARQTW